MTATAITAAPPTAPPMIAPVCELLPEGPEVGESPDVGNGVVKAGKPVGLAVLVPVGPAPEPEEFVPINAPGPISGVSTIHRCEAVKGKIGKIPTTDGHRFKGIPKCKIFALSWAIITVRIRRCRSDNSQ